MVLSGFAAARFAGVSRSLRPAKWSPRESRYCINIGDALNNMFLTHLYGGSGYSPWNPSTSVTGREASMIPLRIVFAVTAILLTRDAFAQRGMWIGTAPFCSGSPADCTDLGMTYVKSDSTGDGGKCWTGTKVYCSGYPAPEIALSGYDDCDGFQCHRTMCGLNPSPGPRVIASESWYFCPICASANYRTIMRLNKVPNAQIGRACPWPYP